jgi:negative regulator of flagellin synthesis FlgM
MSNVSGVRPPNGPGGIDSLRRLTSKRSAVPASGVKDTVEISLAAKLAAQVHDSGAVRTDLVERVRNEIAAGTYETPERIDAVVDRLLPEIFG